MTEMIDKMKRRHMSVGYPSRNTESIYRLVRSDGDTLRELMSS